MFQTELPDNDAVGCHGCVRPCRDAARAVVAVRAVKTLLARPRQCLGSATEVCFSKKGYYRVRRPFFFDLDFHKKFLKELLLTMNARIIM